MGIFFSPTGKVLLTLGAILKRDECGEEGRETWWDEDPVLGPVGKAGQSLRVCRHLLLLFNLFSHLSALIATCCVSEDIPVDFVEGRNNSVSSQIRAKAR